MTPTRVYLVSEQLSETVSEKFLVRAPSQAQAVRHITQARFSCEVASQSDLIACIEAGIKVQVAGESESDTE